MTTVTELKALYVKLGGNAADVALIQTDAEMIEKIKEVAIPAELPSVTSEDNGDVLTVVEGAWAKAEPATPTSELPTVTSDDNGDVLTVVEGAWAKATPSENVIIFEGTATNVDSTITLSNNKTNADIATAYNNGKIVEILVRQTSDNEVIMHYQLGRKSGTDFKFFSFYYSGSDIYAYFASVTSSSVSTSISPTKVKLAIAT